MSRVLLCTGVRAETPYYIPSLGIRVWSVEELCYCLRENAYILDEEIVSKDMVTWLEEDCMLPDLAAILRPYLRQPGSMAAYVTGILEYVGYYPKEEIELMAGSFSAAGSASDFEKKKKRADLLVESSKYTKAYVEYSRLLRELPENEIGIRADVLHNIGVALTGLFMYNDAAYYFNEAYNYTNSEADFRDYLAAKRMSMSDSEYVKFVADMPDYYMASINLEADVDEILNNWERSNEEAELEELLNLKQLGDSTGYYQEVNRLVEGLKEEYRDYIQV
ncbi:MAG: hypothetical protein J6U15_07085 [Lachnospiraceae bacterium]|nr:hypothetical protein [Lachnospiraceae bacterium]